MIMVKRWKKPSRYNRQINYGILCAQKHTAESGSFALCLDLFHFLSLQNGRHTSRLQVLVATNVILGIVAACKQHMAIQKHLRVSKKVIKLACI